MTPSHDREELLRITATDPHPRRHTAVLDSDMSYVDVGGGTPVVFIHGNPTSSYLWRNVIPHVAPLARCLAPDLIGMGDSGKVPSGRYRFLDHVRYLDAWFEALNLTGVILVLHDWGSALGFWWAARHPERVRAIAYMEALVAPVTWAEWPESARKFFQMLRSPAGEHAVLGENVFIERVLPAGVLRRLSEEEMQAYRRPWRKPGEERRPMLQWPREIPFGGEPAGAAAFRCRGCRLWPPLPGSSSRGFSRPHREAEGRPRGPTRPRDVEPRLVERGRTYAAQRSKPLSRHRHVASRDRVDWRPATQNATRLSESPSHRPLCRAAGLSTRAGGLQTFTPPLAVELESPFSGAMSLRQQTASRRAASSSSRRALRRGRLDRAARRRWRSGPSHSPCRRSRRGGRVWDPAGARELRGLGTYGFIAGATAFVVGAMDRGDRNLEDFGYAMERVILGATAMGLGTCWLGGTFTRSRFARSIGAATRESVPAIAAIGRAATRSEQGWIRRRPAAENRKPWSALFFDVSLGTPLTREQAGPFAPALEAVRLAPSASNKQPWRIVRDGNGWHFHLERTPGYGNGTLTFRLLRLADLQRVDMGIAMCHFELAAREAGQSGRWMLRPPPLRMGGARSEHIVTWVAA